MKKDESFVWRPSPEAEAKARLNAAAPDLLAAVQLVIDHNGILTGADWAILQFALAKALGTVTLSEFVAEAVGREPQGHASACASRHVGGECTCGEAEAQA